MGATKYEAYEIEDIELAEIMKAIAHPARIGAIRKMLQSDENLSCEELREGIDISQSAFSRHLRQLADVGIIKSKLVKKNKKSCLCYRVQKDVFIIIKQFMDYIFRMIDLKTDDTYAGIDGFFSRFQTNTDWKVHFQT